MRTIHILVGLPASGKTYFAEGYCSKPKHDCVRLEVDEVMFANHESDDIYDAMIDSLRNCNCLSQYEIQNKNIMVDGLLIKEVDILGAVEAVVRGIAHHKKSIKLEELKVILHYWNEDRESCMKNDKNRTRGLSSKSSIKNLEYIDLNNHEVIVELRHDIKSLNNEIGHSLAIKSVVVKKHEVCNSTSEQLEARKKNIIEGNTHSRSSYIENSTLRSASWCNGGSYGDCFSDNCKIVTPQKPSNFKEFDTVVKKLAPNITLKDYRAIKDECVKMEKEFEHDCYGGGVEYCYWTCNLSTLTKMLKKLGYFKLN